MSVQLQGPIHVIFGGVCSGGVSPTEPNVDMTLVLWDAGAPKCFLHSFFFFLLTVCSLPAPQRPLPLPHGGLLCDDYMLRSSQTAHSSRLINQPGSHQQMKSCFIEYFQVSFVQARGEPADGPPCAYHIFTSSLPWQGRPTFWRLWATLEKEELSWATH